MKILLERKYKKAFYTIGIAYINGKRFSETLEDPDRGLSDNMTESTILSRKIYGETAIPTGTYEIQLTPSPKFANRVWGKKYQGKVPILTKVKGFSGVRIHPFNKASECLGCISFGRNLEKGKVLQATTYYYKLMDTYILPAIQRKEPIYITIR